MKVLIAGDEPVTCALLMIGDGRDVYHDESLASAQAMLPFDSFEQVITIDDREHRLGFAGAIQAAWDQVRTEYVFHLELDFTFNERVPVQEMLWLLRRHPHVAQVALKRQPWNDEERAAGGIVELHPDDFSERYDGIDVWTEHRRFFTTNPSIYSSRLCRIGWPQEPQSEGMFTHKLLADPLLRFAFWGGKHDPPTVTHIGEERVGCGY